ncbi:MAG: hypothetical protein HQL84_07950 [Magnetococcales bacterium]|nr:hypothetical protein [Magnetococcales bacterium]MBF0149962.1 hypothetical protein [Magnetococcales bacterium]
MHHLRILSRSRPVSQEQWRRIESPDIPGQPSTDPSIILLPSLSPTEAQQVINTFNTLVTQLSEANHAQPSWWYTWLSSRCRFNSNSFDVLVTGFRFAQLVKTLEGSQSCYWVCPDPYIATWVAQIARKGGWKVQRSWHDQLRWGVKRIFFSIKKLLGSARWLINGLRMAHAAKKSPAPMASFQHAKVVIISILMLPNLRKQAEAGTYNDIYFDRLPYELNKTEGTTVVFGFPYDFRTELFSHIRRITSIPLCTCWDFLTFGDVWRSIRWAYTQKIRGVQLDNPTGINTVDLVQWDLRRMSIGIIANGYMLQQSLRRFLLANPECRVIHMYENNPWERACAIAAKSLPNPRSVTGYLHCAVLKSHLKNHISPEETLLRPAPDMIVCTGSASRSMFLSLGAHHPQYVAVGCAFRDSNTMTQLRRHPPRQVKRIVVLFEGLPSVIPVLRWIAHVSKGNHALTFIIRGHPVMPAREIAAKAGVTLTDAGPVAESHPGDLAQAILEGEVVLYISSTAVMTAVRLGVPVIHLKSSDILEEDPLIDCPYMKRVAHSLGDIERHVREFESMSETQYHLEMKQATDFLDQLYAKPTPENMKPFFTAPPENQDRPWHRHFTATASSSIP